MGIKINENRNAVKEQIYFYFSNILEPSCTNSECKIFYTIYTLYILVCKMYTKTCFVSLFMCLYMGKLAAILFPDIQSLHVHQLLYVIDQLLWQSELRN